MSFQNQRLLLILSKTTSTLGAVFLGILNKNFITAFFCSSSTYSRCFRICSSFTTPTQGSGIRMNHPVIIMKSQSFE